MSTYWKFCCSCPVCLIFCLLSCNVRHFRYIHICTGFAPCAIFYRYKGFNQEIIVCHWIKPVCLTNREKLYKIISAIINVTTFIFLHFECDMQTPNKSNIISSKNYHFLFSIFLYRKWNKLFLQSLHYFFPSWDLHSSASTSILTLMPRRTSYLQVSQHYFFEVSMSFQFSICCLIFGNTQ